MKPMYMCMAIMLGAFGSAICPAAERPDMAAYANIQAADLQANPSNWWARAISFPDKIAAPPSGRAKKLGNDVRHRSMELAGAGLVWVPAQLTRSFMNLDPTREYYFAGTVNQTADRFHVIVDACFIRTEEDGREQWADAFAPQFEAAPAAAQADAPPVRIEAKLLDAEGGEGGAGVVLPPSAVEPPPTAEQPAAQLEVADQKAAARQARLEAKKRAKEEAQAAKAAARAREEAEAQDQAAAAEHKAETERQAKLETKQKKAAEKQARLDAKRRAEEEAQAATLAEQERLKAEAQAEKAAKAEARRMAKERQAKVEAKEKKAAAAQAEAEARRIAAEQKAEAERQAKLEAKVKKAAEKQARIEAERRAAEEAQAAKAAAQAERERQQTEARAREEAEAQARAIAAQAEADARRMQQEAERIAEEKRQAENAIREARELERIIAVEQARRQAAERQLAELQARQSTALAEVQAIEAEKAAALERIRTDAAAQEAARAAAVQAQLAAQTAQQDEVLRITREMAVRGEGMAGEAARLLAQEEKSRQAVEQDIFRLETESRPRPAEASRIPFQQEAEMQAALRAAELAAQTAAETASARPRAGRRKRRGRASSLRKKPRAPGRGGSRASRRGTDGRVRGIAAAGTTRAGWRPAAAVVPASARPTGSRRRSARQAAKNGWPLAAEAASSRRSWKRRRELKTPGRRPRNPSVEAGGRGGGARRAGWSQGNCVETFFRDVTNPGSPGELQKVMRYHGRRQRRAVTGAGTAQRPSNCWIWRRQTADRAGRRAPGRRGRRAS